MTAMPTAKEIVDVYMAAWNERDAAKRRPLIDACWAEDADASASGLYCDPVADGRGRDALEGFIAGMHAQQPGATILLTSGIDQHHNQIRFGWAFVDAEGKRAIEGIDVGELGEDGRLRRIVGFWGGVPAATE
jgi:hypothetical protein